MCTFRCYIKSENDFLEKYGNNSAAGPFSLKLGEFFLKKKCTSFAAGCFSEKKY